MDDVLRSLQTFAHSPAHVAKVSHKSCAGVMADVLHHSAMLQCAVLPGHDTEQ